MAKRLPHFEVGGTYEHLHTGEIVLITTKSPVDTAGKRPFGWRGSVNYHLLSPGIHKDHGLHILDNDNIDLWRRIE